jgi:hypothetical protein
MSSACPSLYLVETGPLDYIKVNAAAWDQRHEDQLKTARRGWSATEPTWGIFGVSEQAIRLLPSDLRGRIALELGCGTAYVSAWLARRGAFPVGVDPSAGPTRDRAPVPGGVRVVVSLGAGLGRLLRPGGELVFLGNSTLLMLCVPDEDGKPATADLRRGHFGMHRFEWPDDPTIEFHLGHGDWVRLLRRNSFEILDLIELRPPSGATSRFGFVEAWWANRWPCEEVWRARRI